MNEIDLLKGRLDDNFVNDLRENIGAESNEQVETAASGIISALMAGLAKNTERPDGVNSLVSALDRDHDGSLLDDAVNLLFGKKEPKNPKTTDGRGILEHIFGKKEAQVTEVVGKSSGLDKSKILRLMITLAPMILGALGKAKRNRGMDGNGIGDLLRGTVQRQRAQNQEQSLLSRLLDSDGDGNIMEEIADFGSNVFLSNRK
jgi:hypothetical protein